jgi:hypothetical protein
MMDPLTALSLSGNIVQFVDFGSRLLSRVGDLYTSSAGLLTAYHEQELVTNDLRFLVAKLRRTISTSDTDNNSDQDQEDVWSSLKQICAEAANVADEIVGRLGEVHLQDGEHKKFRNLQQAVDSLWSPEEIAALLKRLSSFKEALETRVLFSIRSISSRPVV